MTKGEEERHPLENCLCGYQCQTHEAEGTYSGLSLAGDRMGNLLMGDTSVVTFVPHEACCFYPLDCLEYGYILE